MTFKGNAIPYLPRNRATLGLAWAGDRRVIVSAQAIRRSERFADEADLVPLSSGWDMIRKLRWQSADKRRNVEAYAANLFKRNVEDLIGVNLIARF